MNWGKAAFDLITPRAELPKDSPEITEQYTLAWYSRLFVVASACLLFKIKNVKWHLPHYFLRKKFKKQ